jgi:hypothetical protein
MAVKSPTHTIAIRDVNNTAIPPKRFPTLHVGQTVRYVTNAQVGKVKIKFTGPSPYRTDNRRNTVATTGKILKVRSESTGRGLPHNAFQFLCYLQLPGKKLSSVWKKSANVLHPKVYGGEQHVRRP